MVNIQEKNSEKNLSKCTGIINTKTTNLQSKLIDISLKFKIVIIYTTQTSIVR